MAKRKKKSSLDIDLEGMVKQLDDLQEFYEINKMGTVNSPWGKKSITIDPWEGQKRKITDRYIQNDIEKLKREIEKKKKEIANLKGQVTKQKKKNKELEKEIEDLKKRNEGLNKFGREDILDLEE